MPPEKMFTKTIKYKEAHQHALEVLANKKGTNVLTEIKEAIRKHIKA